MNETVQIEFRTAEEIEARQRYHMALQSFRARMAEALRLTEEDLLRGTGRTTRQIVDAPLGAHFVCVGQTTFSERELLFKHSRSDITLRTRNHLSSSHFWRGIRLPALVIDHAIKPTEDEERVITFVTSVIVGRG